MIVVDDITLKRGGQALFEHLNLTIHPGQHVGMVGRNGVGKSSLFALLRGRLLAEHGEVRIPPRWRMAYLAQETKPTDRSALDWAVDGDVELRRVERAIDTAEQRRDDAALATLHTQFDDLGGYSAAARAAEILNGLGFAAGDYTRPYREFSGGWRIRLNLAQTLMTPADLLLLDEPTNHLDLDAMLWLESHLCKFPGTLLMIAHDREFLDAVTAFTIYLETGNATLYRGNYSSFERQRGESLTRQSALARRQALKAEQINRFVDRFRAKASKARQVQSRLKALEKLQLAEPAHVDSPYQFSFPNASRMSRILIQVEAAMLGYTAPILTTGALQIVPGARIGVLGANGAGKTTLMRTLAGDLAPLNGEFLRGQHSTVGYFAQHQLDLLDGQHSALAHIRRREPKGSEQRHRDYLGGWGFAGDMALRPSASLSGGEKARLVLALIAWQQPALLLLDEPTNHLDIEMRHALTVALQDYEGALVIVSHDRDLLRGCVDEYWLVAQGRVEPFEGDLADYAERIRLRRVAPNTAGADGSRRERRQSAAQQRQISQPLRNALKKLENQLEAVGTELRQIEQTLADPRTYEQPAADLEALLARRGALLRTVETAEADWLAKQQELDALESIHKAQPAAGLS